MGDCPNVAQHIEGPSNYIGHFEWSQEMSKTHKVTRCPGCMRYVIWTPKRAASGSSVHSEDGA